MAKVRRIRHRAHEATALAVRRPPPGRLLVAMGLTAAAAAAVLLPSVNAAAPAAPAAPVALPGPRLPTGLPAQVEDLAAYVQQVSCDPTAKPGAVKFGTLLRTTYPGTSYSVGRDCGADGMASEHYEGRAVDWFVSVRTPAQAARAQQLINWLLAPDSQGRPYANARRLGVMYMIWNNRIWGSYRAAEGWRPYGSCATRTAPGDDTTCHRNHIHFSLSWAGAMGRTSFWTRAAAAQDYGPCRPADLNWAPAYSAPRATPCPSYFPVSAPSGTSATQVALVRYAGATVGPGSTGPVVRAVQSGLGLGIDGSYGAQTAAAVNVLQRRAGLRTSGWMDAGTWRALLAAAKTRLPAPKAPAGGSSGGAASGSSDLSRYTGQLLKPGSKGAAVLALQKALSVPGANGYFGPATTRAVIAFQKARRLTPDGAVGPATWKALVAATSASSSSGSAKPAPSTQNSGGSTSRSSALSRYTGQLLKPGSKGAAVLALQKALSVPGANGYFGPATTRAVIAFQKARRLTPDGVVGPATWKALIAG